MDPAVVVALELVEALVVLGVLMLVMEVWVLLLAATALLIVAAVEAEAGTTAFKQAMVGLAS